MRDGGFAFFKEGFKNWWDEGLILVPSEAQAEILINLKLEWEKWLKEEGNVVNTDTWRRKNFCSLFETRVQVHQYGDDIDQEDEDIGAESRSDITVAVGHVAVGQESGRRTIKEEDDGDDNDNKG